MYTLLKTHPKMSTFPFAGTF